MKLSQEHKDYLAHKHNGGVSNQKGNTFETIYTTKEIVRLFAEGANINTTYLAAQLENVFVDDLNILFTDGKRVYYQLKDKLNLSWGTQKHGELIYDFTCQRLSSKSNKENFRLKIVYSHLDCSVHKNAVPAPLDDVTDKEYFPAYESLTSLLQVSAELRRDLISILNYPAAKIPLDLQSASLEFIRSQWLELAAPNKWVSLAEIKDAYDEKHPECPNFKDNPNVILPSEVVDLLDSIDDFQYTINGSNMYWKFSKMQGQIPVTDSWLTTIISAAPATIQQLLPLLY